MEKDLYRLEKEKTKEGIVDFLKKFTSDVESGRISLTEGPMEVELDVPPKLILDIDVDQEQGKEGVEKSVEVELKWYE